MATEVPVYLFTGFLESGKTKFIQETLEDPRFNKGDRMMLLICEEGVEEYAPDQFSTPSIFLETIEDESELTSENLDALLKKNNCKSVIIEYNGMWMLDDLFAAMPEGWTIYQEFMFVDATTFIAYNTNMRQQTYDKLKSAELVVFNRYNDDIDKMALHKIVRGASRRADIAYEYADGSVVYDDIVDPLPFDLNAPVIAINNDDYAVWYRDMNEELDKYNNKTVCFTGYVVKSARLNKDSFIAGRQVMTCCIQDTRYLGLVCDGKGTGMQSKTWATVTGKIKVKHHLAYGGRKGPVLMVDSVAPAEVPNPEIATFY